MQEKGEGHRGVTIVGEEVLACNAGVHGTILVYNRNLQYVRKVQYDGRGRFSDISADSQYNLYVSDYSNNSVHVFSIDGTHLHSFEKDHKGEKMFIVFLYCVYPLCFRNSSFSLMHILVPHRCLFLYSS